MLKVAIEEIPEGSSDLELTCEPQELDLELGDDIISIVTPVVIKVKLFRQIHTVFAKFEVLFNIESECTKCLEPVHRMLKAYSEIQYRPMPKDIFLDMDDIGIGYYSDEHIDFTCELRETILLELPMNVKCSEDCKGLCPHCGQDLNKEECSCLEPEEVRVSKFAELIKSLEIKRKLEV